MVDVSARLVDRVRRRVRSLEDHAHGVVAAVSGGPDSVALLHALIAARESSGPFPVTIAHLNHRLRGAESDADEAFTADLHARLTAAGVPALGLRLHRIDVAATARADGANLEATARRVRYQWLTELAHEVGVRWIATGHTADDQAETVLHRLLRGTGLQGLRGIASTRELAPGVGVVRPLLQTRRAEIIAYLTALGQPFREDSTNRDPAFTRNRIRHELLPHLAARYNPAASLVLARLAEQAEELYRDEETAAGRLVDGRASCRAPGDDARFRPAAPGGRAAPADALRPAAGLDARGLAPRPHDLRRLGTPGRPCVRRRHGRRPSRPHSRPGRAGGCCNSGPVAPPGDGRIEKDGPSVEG